MSKNMSKKKLMNLIATAIVLNNLSSTVVLGSELNSTSYFQIKTIKSNKENKSNKGFFNDIEEDSTITIEDYDTLLKERIVYDENEFISLITSSKIDSIKLACDIDLSNADKNDVIIKNNRVVIDGDGYSINLPNSNEDFSETFLTLQGDDITLKNIRLKIDNEDKKLPKGALDGVTVLGKNNCLHNVEFCGNFKNAVKISECTGIRLEDVTITGEGKKGTGIDIDSSEVLCKGITIDNTKIGINVIGGKSLVTLENEIDINSPFNLKAHSKVGATIESKDGSLVERDEVFGFTYYNVAKSEEVVKNKNEFKKLVNNPIVNKITLTGNINLKGDKQVYDTMVRNGVYINTNNYHIVV